MDPEFEEIAKSIQRLAVDLISVGHCASREAMGALLALVAKTETVCALAAQELEAKLLALSEKILSRGSQNTGRGRWHISWQELMPSRSRSARR